MAAVLDPDEVFHSKAGKANFQRITRLLISGGTSLLREIFDAIHPPSTLPTILSNPATKKLLKAAKLTKPQWDCLYPSPGMYGKSSDFDVTLLFRLLRTICNLIPPPTGWDALPTSTDHSLTADLARVKYYRNSLYGHVNQGMEIKDDEFPSFWQEISEALVRIAGQISLSQKTTWQRAMYDLLNDPFTVEDEQNVHELKKWYQSDMEVKKSIEEVRARMIRLQMELEKKVNVVTEKVQDEGEGIKEDLKTRTQEGMDTIAETVVREEAQDIKEKLKNTTREGMDMIRVEARDIKDQLGQMHQSLDRLSSSTAMSPSAEARLRLMIVCKAIGLPVSRVSQVVQEAAVLPVTASQPQAVVTTGSGGVNVGNEDLPSAQEVLNFIALKCFNQVDPSNPEEFNGYLQYLEQLRKLLFFDAHSEECRAFRENFLKHPEPRERLYVKAGNSDSDDEWCNKDHKQSEKQLQLKKGNEEHISEETSTNKGFGDLFGDLENAVSVSSFPPKVVMTEKPGYSQEESLKAEGDLPTNVINDSPWTYANILSSIITSEGGVITGKNVKLVCPPGAVDNPLSVNITLEDPSKYYGLIAQKDLENDVMFGAPVICLQPNGFSFKRPVTLTTKFELKNFKCDDVLILHGTEACDGAITWQDITHKSKIDETSEELIVELEHFSLILVLYRRTLIRAKDIASRLNLLSFDYTLLVLLNKSSPSSAHDELALLFVSQDVYHEQFYKDDETSALMQLKKEGFKELHVRSISGQEEKRICNDEKLQVNVHLGNDYRLANSQHEKIDFNVHSSVWWNAGDVIRCPLEWINPVRSLCGKITVQGEYGHTSKRNFSEGITDLCGYVRSLLGVKEAIFNLKPLACLLGMPEELMNQVTKPCKDEDEQLDIILQHWSKNTVVEEDLVSLRTVLEDLNQEDYRVTQRGQMHIRHVRKLAAKISGLQYINADSLKYFSHKVETLSKSVLSDCCIELEGSADGVERAASSINHADRLVNHFIKNNRSIPEDIARKYKRVCSLSEESSTKTFLAIVPHLIQNIKDIFVDYERTVPHNGLKGLSEEKLNQFESNVRNAERNKKKGELVYVLCKILELLCLKNDDKQAPADIEKWGKSLEIPRMLILLKPFFQHCMQDVRLQKRLDLFSCRLRDILTDREDIDEVFMHDFSNVLLSLIHFAKFDPSKLVRFELVDSTNTPLNFDFFDRLNVQYDKHGNTFSQRFNIRKESEDELQLHAIAYVNIGGRDFYKKGAFQSVIMLNASGEEAFNTCMKRFDVAVMKLKDKSSGNLRLVLCSTQKEKLVEALDALIREVSEDLLDLSQSKITLCHLQMRSIDPAAGAVLSLGLEYKWGSEAVILDSKDFVTFADSSAGGACIPEIQLIGLEDALMAEGAAAFPLTSTDGKFPLGSFDQLQRHGRLQCEKIEYHLHQTVNQMTGHVCVAGDKATVNEQMPSQRALQEGPSDAPKRSITDGKRC